MSEAPKAKLICEWTANNFRFRLMEFPRVEDGTRDDLWMRLRVERCFDDLLGNERWEIQDHGDFWWAALLELHRIATEES